MSEFLIGNWLVTDEGIEWLEDDREGYFIDKERLLESRGDKYDWLVHMPQKTWLTREDIYALNTAYIYAMEKFGVPFDRLSFVSTFHEQEQDLKRK